MKRVIALCLLLAAPVFAAPAPWWNPPPEVNQTVRNWMAQMAVPFDDRPRPYRETRQARDRKGVVWLTFVRVGDDVKNYNRDGILVCHAWIQGRQFVVWSLSPDGRWHRAR